MFALGTEFDVYETVYNLHYVFENRESHFQTDKVKNNTFIESVCREIENPLKGSTQLMSIAGCGQHSAPVMDPAEEK